ncbi:alpha/beta hydrolase [Paenibacillus antri]|uniref:Alpha/beta hydrolase n=1 Tax=Paenibacillus antri TaxID=2582848 RepID=A0A5R9GGV4_9BACL|nr:alpha/beta hydrolase [Paenibacillus antri]TLS53410.1 alpha/beta hydrolase [Paenibacillus antri]
MPKASVNGTILHYHVHGRGTPIVFIHPPLLNRAVFRYQEVQLADPFQVVTFDIRGHGFSPASETPVTYALIAEDIKALLDHLNIRKAYLCGYSAGAGVAMETMLTYPDRIRGGILLGAMAEPFSLMVRGQLAVASALAKLGMKTSLALLIAKANADMPETFHNLYYEAIRGDIRNWQQYYEAGMKFSATGRLGSIQAPTLLVYGANDRSAYAHGVELHQMMPDSTLARIPDIRHHVPTKGMDAFHDLVTKWIMQHELRAASNGESHVDKNLIKKAMDYDLRIPDDVLADHGIMR